MKAIEKLSIRLKAEHGVEIKEGSYSGYISLSPNQVENGAWRWMARTNGGDVGIEIGSLWPVTDLLKAKKLRLKETPFRALELSVLKE